MTIMKKRKRDLPEKAYSGKETETTIITMRMMMRRNRRGRDRFWGVLPTVIPIK
jgi:hypothetical protein